MGRLDQLSFDRMTAAQLGTTGVLATVGAGIVTTTGRNGDGLTGTGATIDASNTIRTRTFNPFTPTIGYRGIAVKVLSLPASNQKFWAGIDSAGDVFATAAITPSGKVALYSGTLEGGTLLGTSPLVFFSNVFRYLEFGHVISAGGRLEARSTLGTSLRVFAQTPVTLTATGSWVADEFYLTDQIVIDDYYLNDAGAFPNYFSGDTMVVTAEPIAIAFEQSLFDVWPWVASTGSDRVALVDDATLDGDATYDWAHDISFSSMYFQMAPITPVDGREVQGVKAVAIIRPTVSDWNKRPSIHVKFWYGVIVRNEFNPPALTSYRAIDLVEIPGPGVWGSIENVNNTLFGIQT